MRKPRLLWIGDGGIKSGFARVGHSVCETLHKMWDLQYMGIGYSGDPHPYPYPMRVARKYGKGDPFGISRISEICEEFEPDVIMLNTDAFIICGFLEEIQKLPRRPLVAAYSPIDTPGVKREIINRFHKDRLDLFISYTEFGVREIRKSGWLGMTSVIPHGVDVNFFKPYDKAECRRKIVPGIPEDAFLVGIVNRNQPRKRIDLAMIYFAEWLDRRGDGYLWIHCAKKDAGWDLVELARQLGIEDRVFMPGVVGVEDMPEDVLMPLFYSMLDLQISTPLGEGWGLTVMEGMACGVPQIVPQWAGLGEWAVPAAMAVSCTSFEVLTGYHAFGIGGIADKEEFISTLDLMASSPMLRSEKAIEGRELVSQPIYHWPNIANRFHKTLAGLLSAPKPQPMKGEEMEAEAVG